MIRPLGDRVLIRVIDEKEQETSASGIILPEAARKDKKSIGIVVEIGTKIPKDSVKVGNKVMFTDFGYDEIEYEGKKYLIMTESNLIAIINK